MKTIEEKINYYKDIFDLECAKDKATNNRGNGNPILYGTRNFRAILHGVAYRGGGNNYYHKTNKRNNKNSNHSNNTVPATRFDEIINFLKRFVDRLRRI